MNRKRIAVAGALLVASLLVLTGCLSPESLDIQKIAAQADPAAATAVKSGIAGQNPAQTNASKQQNRTIKIGFSFGQSMIQAFTAMARGAQDAAGEFGVELYVTTADFDTEKQITDVEDLVQEGIQVLMINPINEDALAPTIKELKQKGIGIILMESNITGFNDYITFVGDDNYSVGVMAADYIGEYIGKKGKVAILGAPQLSNCRQRENGFKDELGRKYPDIEIVANQGTALVRMESISSAETIVQAHPDIKAFFAIGGEGAMGALSAVQSAKLKDTLVVGVDSVPELWDAIKNAPPPFVTVSQNPYYMGYRGLQAAVQWINGREVPKKTLVDVFLVDKDNLQQVIEKEGKFYNYKK